MTTHHTPPEDDRLSATVRVNLLPAEHARLQELSALEDRPVASIVRRAVREMFTRMDYAASQAS